MLGTVILLQLWGFRLGMDWTVTLGDMLTMAALVISVMKVYLGLVVRMTKLETEFCTEIRYMGRELHDMKRRVYDDHNS